MFLKKLRSRSSSVASSTGSNHGTVSDSTVSSFAPEDSSTGLPLRTTAKKYQRWAPRDETNVHINTSAIGRAFPGFSEGGSSDESRSLEAQRVPRSRQQRPNTVAQPQYSDNFDSSNIVTIGNLKLHDTPRKSSSNMPRRDTGSHKENIPPHSTQQASKQASPYVSHASRATSGERQTLAELHAKVADDTTGSIIVDERPATVTFQPKHAHRFSTKLTTQHNIPHSANVSTKRQEVDDDLAERLRTVSGTPSKSQIKQQTNHTTISNNLNPTQRSFLLPDMPESSQVIPTSFNKGTGIPLPREEQDIYIDIDLVKNRAADLESQLAQALKQNEQHEAEIRQLRRQSLIQDDQFKLQMERDQAVAQLSKSFDNVEKLDKENAQLDQKVTSLAVSNEDLEQQNSQLHRQVVKQAGQHEKLTKENEHLKQQNAALIAQKEKLKMENGQLKQSIETLFTQNEELRLDLQDEHRKLMEEMTAREEQANDTTRSLSEIRNLEVKTQKLDSEKQNLETKYQDLETRYHNFETRYEKIESKTHRLEKTIADLKRIIVEQSDELTQHITKNVRTGVHATHNGKAQSSTRNERTGAHTPRIPKPQSSTHNESTKVNVTHNDKIPSSRHKEGTKVHATHNDKSKSSTPNEQTGVHATRNHKSQLSTQNDRSGLDATGNDESQSFTLDERNGLNATRDDNSQSVIQNNPMDESADSSYASILGPGFLKNVRQQMAARAEEDFTLRSYASHRRHRSESFGQAKNHTLKSTTSHRRHHSADEMTSAFIIPDISVNTIKTADTHPALSASARRVLDGLCKHECKNCTICSRVVSFETKQHTKHTIQVPKPVPVSDRMPESTPYQDEPTIRPSMAPGLALAKTIRSLEDEVTHLQSEHSRTAALYDKHDPSISMRQRKALKSRLEELQSGLERKSAQVYQLYDVLEGQKRSGQMMMEKDLEFTILSIIEDIDLPWEGIEEDE